MTERTLLVRAAFDSQRRYFALAMDIPSVRVFDCATGQLAAIAELPSMNALFQSQHNNQRFSSLSGDLSATSLTSLAFGDLAATSQVSKNKAKQAKGKEEQAFEQRVVLAAGMSDGSLLLHNVVSDTHLFHLLLSETQQSILSIATVGSFAVCLTKDAKLFIVVVALRMGWRYLSVARPMPCTTSRCCINNPLTSPLQRLKQFVRLRRSRRRIVTHGCTLTERWR